MENNIVIENRETIFSVLASFFSTEKTDLKAETEQQRKLKIVQGLTNNKLIEDLEKGINTHEITVKRPKKSSRSQQIVAERNEQQLQQVQEAQKSANELSGEDNELSI